MIKTMVSVLLLMLGLSVVNPILTKSRLKQKKGVVLKLGIVVIVGCVVLIAGGVYWLLGVVL